MYLPDEYLYGIIDLSKVEHHLYITNVLAIKINSFLNCEDDCKTLSFKSLNKGERKAINNWLSNIDEMSSLITYIKNLTTEDARTDELNSDILDILEEAFKYVSVLIKVESQDRGNGNSRVVSIKAKELAFFANESEDFICNNLYKKFSTI